MGGLFPPHRRRRRRPHRRGPVAAERSLARYGITEGRTGNYGWSTVAAATASDTRFRRWNATATAGVAAEAGDFRNEPFQFGWVVEIDPFDPASTPRKRTALGRMNHEGCEVGRTIAGVRPAFYMGDDAQNEYIYKFVSAQPWSAADATRERPARGRRQVSRRRHALRRAVRRERVRGSGCRWSSARGR